MTLFLILLNPDLFLLRWVLKVEVIHDASPWRVDISSIYQETETKPARIDATAPCFEDKATVNRSVQRHREPKHLLNNGTDRGNCIKNVKDHGYLEYSIDNYWLPKFLFYPYRIFSVFDYLIIGTRDIFNHQ